MTTSGAPAALPAVHRVGAALVLTLGAGVPLAFLGIFFAWPTLSLVSMGFIKDGSVDLSGFVTVLGSARIWGIIGQTLAMAIAGTIGSILLGLPGAYVLYRCRFPGRAAVRALIAVPFVLPTVAVSAGFRFLLRDDGPLGFLGLDGSMTAIVIAMIFFNMCLAARLIGSMWARLDQRPEQAARALGAGGLRVFITVTLPALLPAIMAAASIIFLYCATAYAIVLVLGRVGIATIETQIYTETTTYLNLRVASVLSIVQLVIVVAALLVAGRVRGRFESALRLQAGPSDHRLGRADLPVAAIFVLSVGMIIVLPLVQILLRSFRRQGQWTWRNYLDLGTNNASAAISVPVTQALATSLHSALFAATVALVMGVCVALVVSRRPRSRWWLRARSVLDATFMLPLGISAVTVGFGFLITLNAPPLNLTQSPLLVPLAQAVVAIPLVVRTILPVLRSLDPRQLQAAAVLGASPLRTLITIEGPFLLRAAGVAFGFACAVSLGEFGATSFLVRPQTPTLPVVIYQLVLRPGAVEQGMAMAAAVLLSLVSAIIMVIAEHLRGNNEVGI